VISALAGASATSPDTLTASVMRETSQTATAALIAQFAILQGQVSALILEVKQTGMTPARVS
jgi:hypothetical protein